jgi:Tfp pilus assembly protein PilO
MKNEQITKLTPTSKFLLGGSIVVIVAVASYNWCIAPQASYLQAASAHEDILAIARKKTTVISERVDTNRKKISQLQEDINKIEGSFFTRENSREFFSDLDPLSRQCDCTIDTLNFIAPEPVLIEHKNDPENEQDNGEAKVYSSGIVTKGATISLAGKYEGIVQFLKKLGSYSQRIIINDLYIESTSPESDILSCYINIKVYVIEDRETLNNE